MSIPSSFFLWLQKQLDKTHFSQSEASRRAGLNLNAISDIATGKTRNITIKTAIGLGRVFGVPPEDVLREARVLPPLPPAVKEEREVIAILRSLSPDTRAVVVKMIGALKETVGQTPLTQIKESAMITNNTPGIDEEIKQFLVEYPEQRPIIQEAQEHPLGDEAIRAIMYNVRLSAASFQTDDMPPGKFKNQL